MFFHIPSGDDEDSAVRTGGTSESGDWGCSEWTGDIEPVLASKAASMTSVTL